MSQTGMLPRIVSKFGDLRIPARCPSCGAQHQFYYRWLRHSGGYCCSGCDRIVSIDLVDLDMAVLRLDQAITGLTRAVGRISRPEPQSGLR